MKNILLIFFLKREFLNLKGTTVSNTPFYLQENVEGGDCSRCKSGFFNLQEKNKKGCDECFCSGVSDRCQSSYWTYGNVSSSLFILYAVPRAFLILLLFFLYEIIIFFLTTSFQLKLLYRSDVIFFQCYLCFLSNPLKLFGFFFVIVYRCEILRINKHQPVQCPRLICEAIMKLMLFQPKGP